jgi:DNA-binding HxlR family transcriptional regulator
MTKTPTPGRPVRGSRTGRPIMALLDLLGRRWTLRLLWELRDGRPAGFRELQARAGDLSPTILSTRLRELRDAGIIEEQGRAQALSPAGVRLVAALAPLVAWADTWRP